MCQCPHGLMPHCYRSNFRTWNYHWNVSMPSRANASLLRRIYERRITESIKVSMPSRANASLLHRCYITGWYRYQRVSMPSRANASLLPITRELTSQSQVSVSMPSRANASLLRKRLTITICTASLCQCPHGLMPHCYMMMPILILLPRSHSVNALTG